MEKDTIVRLHKSFEQNLYKDQQTGLEFWLARELQILLGYSQWRSFEAVIEKAKIACKNSGHNPQDHFAQMRKLVPIGSDAKREIDDIALTRYACYLIAQNGDPSKDPIVFAQTIIKNNQEMPEIMIDRNVIPEAQVLSFFTNPLILK